MLKIHSPGLIFRHFRRLNAKFPANPTAISGSWKDRRPIEPWRQNRLDYAVKRPATGGFL
ncbi:hypothetical protein RHEC894_CH00217 [Rhizobium sp. CIAT894]|nr:hypothetical protein RHEC894_CH00217 [Rhizobium sp. CIAT894]